MLPKAYRLPHGTRLASARSYRSPLFLLKIDTTASSVPRFGIIISKKIDKRAVRRNRMRRLLQSFIQDNMSIFPPSYDYLFIVVSSFDELAQHTIIELKSFLSNEL